MDTPLLRKDELKQLLGIAITKVPDPIKKLLECCLLWIENSEMWPMGHMKGCEGESEPHNGPSYCGYCGGYIGR